MINIRRDDITDDYHGTKVADPFRWLEDAELPDTIKWVEFQQERTKEFLKDIPERTKIRERLEELWNYPKHSIPRRRGNRYFYYKNDGLQNQSILYMREGIDGNPEVVIDPNKLSEDGTISISSETYSKDGKFIAYNISRSGSDNQEIKIRKVDEKKDFDEIIKWCRFSGVAWKDDNSGFYYNRFPAAGTVSKEDEYYYNKLYWHTLGTDQEKDELIYERRDDKKLKFYPSITEDNKFLTLQISHACISKNRIYYRPLDSKDDFIRLIDEPDSLYYLIYNNDDTFYFHTDFNASRGRIIAIDINNPERENWKEIIAEQEDVIEYVNVVNNQFVIVYLHNAHHKIRVYNLDGTFSREIKLPDIGTVQIDFTNPISGKKDNTDMFFPFTSFLYPACIYHYDFKTDKMTKFLESKLDFNRDNYEVKQVFYESKDKTKVPMFIFHKKGIKLDGNNPAILFGYGGFNISLTPGFSPSRIVWMEMGGVCAIANLRGGGEYGEDWHRAGMLENKQNVFDDFIYGAKYLTENNYSNPSKIAIMGGSNGGLLVSACIVQSPETFGAVICSVPLIDMLRFHKFTVGHLWVVEYGHPEENPDDFKYIHAYSPLHNVKKDALYPPIMVVTADTDDRVVPGHAKKFVATLQTESDSKNIVLLRIETKAGHGHGKPTSKILEEHADIYSFLSKIFNIKTEK